MSVLVLLSGNSRCVILQSEKNIASKRLYCEKVPVLHLTLYSRYFLFFLFKLIFLDICLFPSCVSIKFLRTWRKTVGGNL